MVQKTGATDGYLSVRMVMHEHTLWNENPINNAGKRRGRPFGAEEPITQDLPLMHRFCPLRGQIGCRSWQDQPI